MSLLVNQSDRKFRQDYCRLSVKAGMRNQRMEWGMKSEIRKHGIVRKSRNL